MKKAVKLKYITLIEDIERSVEKLKEEIDSIELQKRTLNNRLKILETQREELKTHIG